MEWMDVVNILASAHHRNPHVLPSGLNLDLHHVSSLEKEHPLLPQEQKGLPFLQLPFL